MYIISIFLKNLILMAKSRIFVIFASTYYAQQKITWPCFLLILDFAMS